MDIDETMGCYGGNIHVHRGEDIHNMGGGRGYVWERGWRRRDLGEGRILVRGYG